MNKTSEASRKKMKSLLLTGKENAISRIRLVSEMKVSDRQVRKIIEELVEDEMIPIWYDEIFGGYFIIDNPKDAEIAYGVTYRKGRSVMRRLRTYKGFEEKFAQKEFDF